MKTLQRTIRFLFGNRWLASIILLFLLDLCTYLAFSKQDAKPVVNNQDKVLHALAFFSLFMMGHLSLSFDFFPRLRRLSKGLLLVNWLIWISYGAFLELGQRYLASRDASIGDMLANMTGMLLATLVIIRARLHPVEETTPSGKPSPA